MGFHHNVMHTYLKSMPTLSLREWMNLQMGIVGTILPK